MTGWLEYQRWLNGSLWRYVLRGGPVGWWENHGKTWGDGPADIMDDALDRIVAEFRSEWKREPTYAELEAGVRFAVWDKLNVPDSMKAELAGSPGRSMNIERDHFELIGEAGYAGTVACSHCTWESTGGDLLDVLEQVREHQKTCRDRARTAT